MFHPNKQKLKLYIMKLKNKLSLLDNIDGSKVEEKLYHND